MQCIYRVLIFDSDLLIENTQVYQHNFHRTTASSSSGDSSDSGAAASGCELDSKVGVLKRVAVSGCSHIFITVNTR